MLNAQIHEMFDGWIDILCFYARIHECTNTQTMHEYSNNAQIHKHTWICFVIVTNILCWMHKFMRCLMHKFTNGGIEWIDISCFYTRIHKCTNTQTMHEYSNNAQMHKHTCICFVTVTNIICWMHKFRRCLMHEITNG